MNPQSNQFVVAVLIGLALVSPWFGVITVWVLVNGLSKRFDYFQGYWESRLAKRDSTVKDAQVAQK